MQIGFVSATGRGACDIILSQVVDLLTARGLRLAGTVQENCERTDRAQCDMDVRVVPDGPRFRISQDLGRHAKGCRLNPSALEQAVMSLPYLQVIYCACTPSFASAKAGAPKSCQILPVNWVATKKW